MRDHIRHTEKIGTFLSRMIVGFILAMFAIPASAVPVDADLLLCGGTIHDGSGAKPVVGDVAIRDGRIVAIGKITPGKIGRTINCQGMIIAPGFIDLHTHTDGTINSPGVRPCLNYLIQGCTTMITGNCGGGPLDVAKFLTSIDTNSAGVNILALAPHSSIRSRIMGGQRRAPTAEELERMKGLVSQAMRDGAWGMSTGLIYPPGSYAETDELIALAKIVALHSGIYVSHIRDEGDHLLDAVPEAIRIGRESGAPVHISHFKSMQIPNWGCIRKAAVIIEKARDQGFKITADQYPYTANSFGLTDATLPENQIQWCKRADLVKRMANEPEFAALVRRVIADQLGRTEKIVIAASKKFPDYVGKSLKEIADQEKIEMVDLVLKIVAEESPQIVSHSMSEKDIRWAMKLPWVATASDGAARTINPNEHHHPRNFGTFARKIGRYAIQDKAIKLPHAIRSATGLPADIFGIPERGYIRPGYYADIVVFDPKTYRDQATYDKPQEYATGVRYVFIAGQVAVDDGKPSAKLFGSAIRHRSTEQGGAAVERPAPFEMRVEADEVACHLPPDIEINNGSGMFWGSGSPQIVCIGDKLFVSAFEAVPDCAPLNNARWALYERNTNGWRLCQRDQKDRTREPCPLGVSHSGRLLMSVNPTLAPWVPAPPDFGKMQYTKSRGSISSPFKGGPARPEFLEFDSIHPEQEPKHLVPKWAENPDFTEHSYRAFAADGKNGEFILFNKVGNTHTMWAFLGRDGEWKTGRLTWPKGEDPKYAVWHGEYTPVNYGNAILDNRQAHYIGTSPYNIWNRIDPLKSETWGRDKWGWRMRKIHYAWTPDITSSPFMQWTVVADTMDDGGTLTLGDTWLAADGRIHIVWQQNPIHPKLRDIHFPDIKRDWRLWYGVLKQGRVVEKKVLLSGGETTGPVQPTGRPRFHITPDQTLYILYNVVGTTPATKAQTGNYAVRVEGDGSISAAVRIPLQRPLTDTYFTASPRAGNRLSEAVDLLIADTIDGKPVARYARIRFNRLN
ncbi:MAG: D-aminoacylase [Kiritimatiellae bacterium]|nr:D-aminoacylase [Kiritimatiellia bacterium]MDD5523285.1 D-aminoacylase [Kiritimatiellia bacterium]